MPALSLARKEPLEPTSPWCYAPVWVWEKKNTQHTHNQGRKLPGPIRCFFLVHLFSFITLRLSDTDGYWMGLHIEAEKPRTLFLFWMKFSTRRQFDYFKAKKHTLSETPYLIKKEKWKHEVLFSPKPCAPKISLQVQIRFCWFVVFAGFLIGFSWELSLELCSAVTRSETGSCLSALLTNWKSGRIVWRLPTAASH